MEITMEENVKQFKEIAKRVLYDKGGLTPLLCGILADNKFTCLPITIDDTSDKRAKFAIAQEMLRLLGARIIIAVFDSYYVKPDNTTKDKSVTTFAPSEHPQRKEALCIVSKSADENQMIIVPYHKEKGFIVFEDEITYKSGQPDAVLVDNLLSTILTNQN
ncbi:MAG: hypothetical protein WC955_11885 [Elusimicrobiota bacterium]